MKPWHLSAMNTLKARGESPLKVLRQLVTQRQIAVSTDCCPDAAVIHPRLQHAANPDQWPQLLHLCSPDSGLRHHWLHLPVCTSQHHECNLWHGSRQRAGRQVPLAADWWQHCNLYSPNCIHTAGECAHHALHMFGSSIPCNLQCLNSNVYWVNSCCPSSHPADFIGLSSILL